MSDADVLRALGARAEVADAYERLESTNGPFRERVVLLERFRRELLDQIHAAEDKVMKVDCMRHELRKSIEERGGANA